MSKEKIYIFDTTLRDGAQTEGVDFSVEDKNKIAKILSNIGVDYIEGGWPGANPILDRIFAILFLSSTEKSTPSVCAPSLKVVSKMYIFSLLI